MADYKKVRAGDELSIPAETYNAFIDAAATLKQTSGGKNPRLAVPQNTTIVRIQNTSGQVLDRWSAVAITGVVVPPTSGDNTTDISREFINNATLTVGIPTTNDTGRFLVLKDILSDKAFGMAYAVGVITCQITLLDVTDTAVDIQSGSTNLTSGSSGGGQILWVAGGAGTATQTGNQLAVVRLNGSSSGGITSGPTQYTYLGVQAQNSPLALAYIKAHGV
jgi:hypothetical protein